MKRKIFIIVITFLGIFRYAHGQKIDVLSFEGTNEPVFVLSDDKDNLSVAFLKDTLHIKDVYNVKSIAVLDKRFLKIDYTSRGGSGINLQLTLLLCIRNNKLYQPLHITSLFREEFIDFRKKHTGAATPDIISDNTVKVNISGTSYSGYKMNANVYDWKKSKENPHDDYNKESNIILNFDAVNNVFYNSHAHLSKYFTVYDPKTGEESKQYLMGTFPEVKLGDYIYYYIKGEWYERGGGDDLSKYSYR